jgi:hypothetical protein
VRCRQAIALVLVTVAAAAVALTSPGHTLAQEICPQPDFVGDYPRDEELPWSENVQGVAHDDSHWFFTQQDTVLRLPAGFPLHRDPDFGDSPVGELRRKLRSYRPLAQAGFNHFGDIDQLGGFVFAPLEKPVTLGQPHEQRAAIAVFAASNLELLSVVDVTSIMGFKAGWLAIDPRAGYLYTSPSHVSDAPASYLYRFTIELELIGDPTHPGAWLAFKDRVMLMEADGTPLDRALRHMQGGVITPWGDLVLENGFIDDPPRVDRGGIHIFRPEGASRSATVFRLVTESVNEKGLGGFRFAYDPALDLTSTPHAPNNDEEPEGIDWWNRSPASTPGGARGQLHGIMIDNTQLLHGESNPDDLYFKHYVVDYSCLPDFDGDGVPTRVEVDERGTDPLDAYTIDHIPDGAVIDFADIELQPARPVGR